MLLHREPFGASLKPGVSAFGIGGPSPLIEHDRSSRARSLRAIDQRQRFVKGEGIQSSDQVDVVIPVGEWPRFGQLSRAKKVRILDRRGCVHEPTRKAAIH